MGERILEMENITVQFPGVLALDGVHFEAYRGEVNVLLGENGAGKSTIMKVLAGVNTGYTGTVRYKGEEIVCKSIHEQMGRGISIIFQETNLLGNLTVAENIFLGAYCTRKGGGVDWKRMNAGARRLLDSIGSDIPERAPVSSLSVGQAQMVEIAKALRTQADILIMDEPTSALTEKEVEGLFHIIAQLKAAGVAIVYITHRLKEILEIGDRLTVLRDGKSIKSLPVKGLTVDDMVELMVGRDVSEQFPRIPCTPGGAVLEVRGLTRAGVLHEVSFEARAGEIVCFYGLMGAGRTELMRAIFGADKYDGGQVLVDGKPVPTRGCRAAKDAGIALLTEDRKRQGLILGDAVGRNIALTNLGGVMNRFGLSAKKEAAVCGALAQSVRVKTPSLRQPVGLLSGGNQQKVVIAKWLNTASRVVIFDEPTRGIDVGAKVEIYKIMNELKRQGKAVVMVSSELVEAIGMCDRMYVMHDGRITAQFDSPEGLTEEAIMKAAVATA